MFFLKLSKKKPTLKGEISIEASKSISNRLLILRHLYKNFEIKNLSSCQDTLILKKTLDSLEKNSTKKAKLQKINVEHCGTAMRFLTAYLTTLEGEEIELAGSDQMHKRPIGELVEALNKLGASIFYLEKVGYPPLKIKGQKLIGDEIELESSLSSQFVSALMMIAASLAKGLKISLKGQINSRSYIEMTFLLLKELGAEITWEGNVIDIKPGISKIKKEFFVESDWSSASYYYLMASLSKECDLYLNTYQKNSLQGDLALIKIYKKHFGVHTSFEENKIRLSKNLDFSLPGFLELDLRNTPDLAQSLAVNCAACKIKCKLSGLETLHIKETNRLVALQNELKKLGVNTLITKNTFEIDSFGEKDDEILINTYEDHRMAMAFAPLALLYPIKINSPEVVKKSYPNFWKDLKLLGFEINESINFR